MQATTVQCLHVNAKNVMLSIFPFTVTCCHGRRTFLFVLSICSVWASLCMWLHLSYLTHHTIHCYLVCGCVCQAQFSLLHSCDHIRYCDWRLGYLLCHVERSRCWELSVYTDKYFLVKVSHTKPLASILQATTVQSWWSPFTTNTVCHMLTN